MSMYQDMFKNISSKKINKLKYLQQELLGFIRSRKGDIIDDSFVNDFLNESTFVLNQQYGLNRHLDLSDWKNSIIKECWCRISSSNG